MWTPVIVVAIAAVSYGFYIFMLPAQLPAAFIYGNGHVEGTEISISAEVTGLVLKSNLVEGQEIDKGELLVELDDANQRATLAQAKAETAAIEFEQTRVNAELNTWRDMLATAKRDLVRYEKLRDQGTVAEQRLDQASTVKREALGQVRAHEAQLKSTAARIEAAQSKAEYLRIQLDKTRINTPLTATILAKGIEQGERAQPGRLVAVLVDMNDLDLKIYIPESHIGKIKLNDPARVRVNAFPDRYFEARVKRVDQKAQFTPRDINMPEERTRTVFGVVLALINPEGYLKPGMPADSWIKWDGDTSWPDRLVVPQ